MSSYIQEPFGYRHVSKPIQFVSPKNPETHYLNRIGYISNKDDPIVENNILDAIKNREDLQKYILATSDFGHELQENINEITGGDEKFNNAIVRRVLDFKKEDLFRNPQPITLLFNNVEKFHQQNPIIGKLATQINVSKLTEKELIKYQLGELKDRELADRLFKLKYGKDEKNDDDDNDDDDDEPKSPPKAPPRREAEAEIDPSFRRRTDPERDLEKAFRELRYRKSFADAYNEGDLEKRFRELKYGKAALDKDRVEDPYETIEHKINQDQVTQREDIGQNLPEVPLFDPNSELTKKQKQKPLTRLIDGETIEITPKREITEEKQLSDSLQQLFPDIDNSINENKKADLEIDFKNLSTTLSEIENQIVPFEFEFFNGGENNKFREIILGLGNVSNHDIIKFVNFLQSEICKKILADNKLKIHLETGNKYYDNNDTNESIHNFILAQINPIAGEINHDFTFDRDYSTYFQWINDAFSESKRNKLDILANKNSKFLFYHFNDHLQQNNQKLQNVRHTVITEDFIAAEQTQDRIWKYLVDKLLSFSENAINSSEKENFLLDTKENLLILKKTHDQLYNQIAKNFNEMLKKMPFDLYSEIENDFLRENYEINDVKNLDSSVSFYFKHGRFPGNNDLTILPQTTLPSVVDQLSVEVSPVQLYEKFKNTDSKNLVSFQAIVALFLYYGGEKITAKKAMDEWKENLTFQALSKENDNIIMHFDKFTYIVLHFLKEFLIHESKFSEYEKNKLELFEETLNNYQMLSSTPSKENIRNIFPSVVSNIPDNLSKIDSDFLKTSLTLSKTNLDASIEAAEEKNRMVIQDMIDPTPGLFVDQSFTSDDLNTMNTDDESKFKLNNESMKKVNEITKNLNNSVSKFQEMLNNYELSIKPSKSINQETSIKLPEKKIEILKSDLDTKIKTTKKTKIKSSPYNLRSTKRKFNTIESSDSLSKPFLYFASNENEKDKVEAVEKVFNSVLNNLPEQHRKKLKFNFDSSNNINVQRKTRRK